MTVIDVFFFFILSFILSFSVCSCVRIVVFLSLCFFSRVFFTVFVCLFLYMRCLCFRVYLRVSSAVKNVAYVCICTYILLSVCV